MKGSVKMEKKVITWHGKKYYLIGKNPYGKNCYLKEASWDCDWYWGFGYIETFTNNAHPEKAKDIASHTHFSEVFSNPYMNGYKNKKKLFVEYTVSDKELWKLVELMNTFYTLENYSNMLHRGGTNYSENSIKDIIKNDDEYERINKVVLPKLFEEIYQLLSE